MLRTRLPLLALLCGFAFLPVGCSSGGGGGDSAGTGPGGGSLDGITLSTTTPRSLARVDLAGLPAARALPLDLEIVFVGVEGAGRIPVESDATGAYFLAPFHPVTPHLGGTVTLQVVSSTASSPEFTLELSALEDAPGAFAALVEGLEQHIDGHAQRRGSSLAQLQAWSFEETPAALLPLKYAVSFVDDPANANSLAAIAGGTSSFLSADESRLLDQICGYTDFAALIGLEVDGLGELDPPAARTGTPRGNALERRACIEAGPTIDTANQLSAAMWEAKFAEIAISGDAGQTLTALGATFAGGAMIPGAGLAFTALGGATAAWQASRGFLAGMNPSSFVSITADVDRTDFEEDSEDVGRYSNVQVVAVSKGWSADQALVDAVITALGAYASAAQAATITAGEFLGGAAASVLNQSASAYVGSRDGGVIEFCPQQWTVDISSLLYCEARSVFGRLQVATGAQTYWPAAVGEDFLSISAIPAKFGQETIDVDKPIRVNAIDVQISPSRVEVRTPGEEVAITTTVDNAVDPKLFWDAGPGNWNDGLLQFTNEPRTRPLLTPTNRGDYPFTVTVECISTKGLRASGEPRRLDEITVVLAEDIVVSPANACLDPGESETFTATQGDQPADVIWSLETEAGTPSTFGSISTTGVYTAPASGNGTVIVVATSTTNESLRGEALVEVGTCACFWSLSIGGEGAWSGSFVSHAFPSTFGFFSLTFDDGGANGGGNVQAFSDPVAENQTGVFQPENFGFQSGERSWTATSDPEAQTPFTMFIEQNDGTTLVGSVSGTCLTFVNGEGLYRGFTLNFRSGNLGSGEAICGGQ